jgi:hypothetical protein
MDAAPIIVTQASAVSDLPGVLRRGQEHFDAYVRAADGAFAAGLGHSPMPAEPCCRSRSRLC